MKKYTSYDIYFTLGDNVKKYRKRKKLTQTKLAELCGVERNTIAYIEEGTKFIRAKSLARLCNVLEVTPKQLFE
jgi:transcriptional regulator with XRE-family HTH domain